MQTRDYLRLLVEQIHSAVIAKIGADGHPQTCVIDMMLWDDRGVYFLTAKGKAFYEQFMKRRGSSFDINDPSHVTRDSFVIDQNHCLHCGRCAEICPKQVIEKR